MIETAWRPLSCARRWIATSRFSRFVAGCNCSTSRSEGRSCSTSRGTCPGQREVHSITVAANSKLRSILGVDEYVVNSRHHQCVDKLVNGLVVTARAGSAPEAARSLAEFVEWTADAHLRHSRFMGLRDDKNPTDVRRE